MEYLTFITYFPSLFFSGVIVEFEFPNYTVLETNGSVAVCAITSTGIARFLNIGFEATAKMTINAATREPIAIR